MSGMQIERRADGRASGAHAFGAAGCSACLRSGCASWSRSINQRAPVLRGIHPQRAPKAEAALDRCRRGAIPGGMRIPCLPGHATG
jgi:hypothetical protein